MPLQDSSQWQDIVRDIATQSVAEVERLLSPASTQMSVAELRGYVRARAVRTVQRQTRLVSAKAGQESLLLSEVFTRALERTVYLVVRRQMTASTIPTGLRVAC